MVGSRVERGCVYFLGRDAGPERKPRGGKRTKVKGACPNMLQDMWGGDAGTDIMVPCCDLVSALLRLAATSGQSCHSQGLSFPICEQKPRLKP